MGQIQSTPGLKKHEKFRKKDLRQIHGTDPTNARDEERHEKFRKIDLRLNYRSDRRLPRF